MCVGRPGAGVPGPQEFGGGRATAAFTRGRHPGFSSPHHHQGAAGLLGHGEFLQEVSAQHRPRAAAADGRLARGQEGGGQAGVVGGHGCRLCRRQAVPPHSITPGTSHIGGGAVSGHGRLGDARRGVPAAAVTWPEDVAAPGLLLKEAGGGPAEIFRLRQGAVCLLWIPHFRYMLDGRGFAIFTDHKPLTYALARVSEPWTARQSRQLSYVAEYTSDISHIARAANVVADTLSRPLGHTAAERPSSAATCVKMSSGSQVVALQGDTFTFTSWHGGERGRRAAGDWRVFPQDGGQPGQLFQHAAGD